MSERRMMHPFKVFWDVESQKHYIFAPPGCVLVGGVAVEIEDGDSDHNVALSFQNNTLPAKLYAHVTADAEATGGYKVEFDGNATKEGAEYDFCVTSFGEAENDGGQYDMCTSVISLHGGGGRAVPGAGCYTIVDVEETVDGETVTRKYLANQYYLDGNVAKSTNFTDPLDPATQYGKFIALRVPMGTSGSPSIQTYATYAAMNTASLNAAYVTLPLYHLDANGDVICDFRNAPRVQAVEVLS